MSRSHVTTHVLDTATGRPAAGIAVRLESLDGAELGAATTDADGRVAELGPARLPPGDYRLRFDIGGWAADGARASFYPEIAIAFTIEDAEHYHVPLLLSPFGYTTYRGS